MDASHPSFKDGQALYDGMLLSFQDIFIFKGVWMIRQRSFSLILHISFDIAR